MAQRNVSKDEVALDQALIARIAAGDQEAFAALYDRLASQAYSLAVYVTKDGRTAEDVVQEAFVNIWRMAGSYTTGRGSVSAWAMTVVRNRAVDHLRRLGSRPQIASDLENVIVATPHDEVWTSVAQTLDADTVRNALGCLPPEQREAIEMGFFNGLSHQEIAERTGLPLGTVKSRMRNGLRKMRANLTGEERTPAR